MDALKSEQCVVVWFLIADSKQNVDNYQRMVSVYDKHSLVQKLLQKVGKTPIGTDYDGVSCKRFNGRSLLISASANRLRMVSLDTTGCWEDGKWRRTDSSDVVGEDVTTFMIV
ncbi:hypothetical protein TNCV_1239671 [Trichonephila clavipes]|nr:hypothetical protein TNCV_1239671 [Trichonephila clavipes]